MRLAAFRKNGMDGLAARSQDGIFHGLFATDANYPGELSEILTRGGSALAEANSALLAGPAVDLQTA
ncbi:MAG TPA: hypothetical protein VNH18_06990, partial [Bryobacteraceae bacterium]|nr:hypothetical protein [Bryobacteraceae bacterium]